MAGILFTEGSGLNDSIFGKSQAPIRMFLEKKAESFESMSLLPELFNVSDSKNWGEKMTAMTAMNGFEPVGENGKHPVSGMQEGFSKFLEHETWKNSFAISREIIDDGKLMNLKGRPQAFITAYYRTKEMFAAALYAAAINGKKVFSFGGKTFDATGADGLELFHKAHPSVVEGVTLKQSNLFKEEFSVDALGAMESKMQDFRGDKEEVLAVAPNTILIPNDHKLKKDVFAAIGADKDPATANNGFNYQFGRWTVIIWQYLNQFIAPNVKPWVLLDSNYNKENDGAVWLDRVKLEVNSDIDKDTDANVWRGYARFTAGFNDWRAFAIGGISSGSSLGL